MGFDSKESLFALIENYLKYGYMNKITSLKISKDNGKIASLVNLLLKFA